MAGSASVQVMLSSSGVFFGDIARHQPAVVRFSELLAALKAAAPAARTSGAAAGGAPAVGGGAPIPGAVARAGLSTGAGAPDTDGCTPASGAAAGGAGAGAGAAGGAGAGAGADAPGAFNVAGAGAAACVSPPHGGSSIGDGGGDRGGLRVYLAQQPLTGGLAPLLEDVPPPACLAGKDIATTNLWMCGGLVRSSLHYDPHHNLLALVTGRKVVTLIPPHLTPCVYPMAIAGDAPNHSHVPFADPDPAERFPAYRAAMAAARRVELRAGDALFIPEGWWHQVDSGPDVTIAVNYWWRSALTETLMARPHSLQPAVQAVAAAAATAEPSSPPPPPTMLAARIAPSPAAAAGAAAVPATAATDALAMAEPSTASYSTAPVCATPTHSSDHGAPTPGPGLRNLFALRQLARAAVDDIAAQLIAGVAPAVLYSTKSAMAPPPSPSSIGPQPPGTRARVAPGVRSDAVASAAAGAAALKAAIRASRPHKEPVPMPDAVGGPLEKRRPAIDSARDPKGPGTAAKGAAAAAPQQAEAEAAPATAPRAAAAEGRRLPPYPPAPRDVPPPPPSQQQQPSTELLPPHTAGLLLLLRPGEAAALGLTNCPVASVLAAASPAQLAVALYGMCRSEPCLVSELLSRCCRVPAVACLLTGAFDCLAPNGGDQGHPDISVAGGCGGGEGAEGAPATGVRESHDPWGAEGHGPKDARQRWAAAMGYGVKEEGAEEAAEEEQPGKRIAGVQAAEMTKSPRCAWTAAADKRPADVSSGGPDGAQGAELGSERGAAKRRRLGDAAGPSAAGGSGDATGVLAVPVGGVRIHGPGAGSSADGTGGGGIGGGGTGGGGTGGRGRGVASPSATCGSRGAAEAVPPPPAEAEQPTLATGAPADFFERLYGTVDDPDEVFQLLLEGRAALHSVARRLLLETVLA